jgi:hypothetical protein
MQIANHSGRIPMLTRAAHDAQETQEQGLNHFVLHRVLGHAQVMYANLDSMTAWNHSSAWETPYTSTWISVANDLKVGKRPASMQPDEATVYEFCMDLAKDHVVSDATFKKARELFSDHQIVDLITVNGVYTTLAMLSNTAEDATPGGNTPPLQPLPAH